MNNQAIQLEATKLRGQVYAVRPMGALGTGGWSPVPWTVQYIKASSAQQAIARANPIYHKTK